MALDTSELFTFIGATQNVVAALAYYGDADEAQRSFRCRGGMGEVWAV